MEITLTKTVSELDFMAVYGGDFGELHRELRREFETTYPTSTMMSASGCSLTNEDGSITYTFTVQYEI